MTLPVPQSTGADQIALDAMRSGRMLLPQCRSCQTVHWPPKQRCPHCEGQSIEYVQAQGGGTLESLSVVHHVGDENLRCALPFTIGLIRLREGPRLMGWLLGTTTWVIGQAVRIHHPPAADGQQFGMPCFVDEPDAKNGSQDTPDIAIKRLDTAAADADEADTRVPQPVAATRLGSHEHDTGAPTHTHQAHSAIRPNSALSALRGVAVISGCGDSEIGRIEDTDGLGLCVQAAWRALDDAQIKASHIDALFTAYSTTSPEFVFYGALAEAIGIRPAIGLTGNAGGGTAGNLLARAVAAIATGQARHVLIVAGENRLSGLGSAQTTQTLSAFCHPRLERPYGLTVPAMYALVAQRYLHTYGLGRQHLAPVAVQSRLNAARHGGAHKTSPISIDDVMNSQPIAEPIHLLDCCLISDAAGALVVSAAESANERAVWIAGIGEQFTHEHLVAAPDDLLAGHGARASGERAFAMAGLGATDVQLAQLYDCFTVTPVMLAEALGLAAPGSGWQLWHDGGGAVESVLPINTHGGMLSHAHAGAAGGLFAINECARQVRGGLGSRQVGGHDVGLVHVEGGILSNHTTAILTAQRP